MPATAAVIFGVYLLGVLMHELGHAIASELLGAPIKGVKLTWLGIGILRDAGSPLPNILISSAGPLMSLLVGLAAWPSWKLFAMANFCLFIANIAPIAGSDGDRIWTCAAKLGWIDDPKLPRRGLGRRHAWLLGRGFSTWDLEQMELADDHPPAPGLASLPKMESNIYLSRPVTNNSCNP